MFIARNYRFKLYSNTSQMLVTSQGKPKKQWITEKYFVWSIEIDIKYFLKVAYSPIFKKKQEKLDLGLLYSLYVESATCFLSGCAKIACL